MLLSAAHDDELLAAARQRGAVGDAQPPRTAAAFYVRHKAWRRPVIPLRQQSQPIAQALHAVVSGV